jgi:hypothetical protein
MSQQRQRILVLHWSGCPLPATMRHHLGALALPGRQHEVLFYDIRYGVPTAVRRSHFDAVVLHTTVLCLRWWPRFEWVRHHLGWLADLDCPRVALPQDEYDLCHLLDAWLAEMNVSAICTAFDERTRKLLYPRMSQRATFHECLTGYIDEATARRYQGRLTPVGRRRLDLVYRAAHLPFWYGTQGQLKHRIGTAFAERAAERGLRHDISTRPQDRFYNDRWFDFLASARATIGCESGTSTIDPRGRLRQRIQQMLAEEPGLSFEELYQRLPPGWDDQRFFAISPRHFETIIMGTGQILVEGEYNGILIPHRHYFPLRRDFSNIDEALDWSQDDRRLGQAVEAAYEEIYRSGRYTYTALSDIVEEAIAAYRSPHPRPAQPPDRPPFHIVQRTCRRAQWRDRVMDRLGALAARLRLTTPMKATTLAGVFWGSPLLGRLMDRYYRDSSFRRRVGFKPLIRDLLLLHVLTDPRHGWQLNGQAFSVRLSYQLEDQRVLIRSELGLGCRSSSAEMAPEQTEAWEELEQAFRMQRIREVVWDHSRCGIHVDCFSALGSYKMWLSWQGAHTFTGLLELSRHDPAWAVQVLQRIDRPLEIISAFAPKGPAEDEEPPSWSVQLTDPFRWEPARERST